MPLALGLVFAAGVAAVALSLVAVVTERASDRLLLWVTVALAIGAAAAGIALGLDLASDFTDTDALILASAGLAATAIAEAGLLALNRGLRRLQQIERQTAVARAEIAAFAEEE